MYEDKVQEKNRVKRVNLSELPFLKSSIEGRISSRTSEGKEEDELAYYLEKINSENVIEITDTTGFKNYTFALKIAVQDTLFNLTAKETDDGYNYYIIKYSSENLEQWINDKKLNQQSLITPEITAEYFEYNRVKYYKDPCIVVSYICPSGQHFSGGPGGCDYSLGEWSTVFDFSGCGVGGGGGSGDDGTTGGTTPTNPSSPPSGGGGGGSGGSGTPTAPIVTVPNFGDVDGEIDHVKELIKLSSKLLIKQKINSYRAKLATRRKEEGILINPSVINDTVGGDCTKTETKFNTNLITEQHTVIIHMHQNLYYAGNTTTLKPTNPIPSDQDVLGLSLGAFRFNNNPNHTSIIVTRLGTFAIRITNPTKALAAINAIDPDNNLRTIDELQKKFITDYNKNVQRIFEQGNEDLAMQAFINFINTYTVNGQTIGLSIYQATFNSSGTSITNWVKL